MENTWKLSEEKLEEHRNQEQTPDEKEFSEYMKSIGVRNISIIAEKTMAPLALITFIDKTEEYIRFSNEEIQNMIDDKNLIKWTYILSRSERLKNKNIKMEEQEYELIKDSSLSERELEELREIFKREYAKKKGWDPNNLTNEQLNEIVSDKRWEGNFMIKS